MSNCFIYCRVSTEEQADKGYSLDAQEKLCRDFADKNNYQVSSIYREEGKTATNLDRPALQEMLSKCTKDSGIAAIIVQETDRLARNTKDHLTIKAMLKKAGVRVISISQPMLDDSPEGMMIDTILASVNQFQSDLNGRKTSRGLQERFEQGLWPGWAPLGYLNVQRSSPDGKARSVVINDPDRWRLVQEGFRLYLTGDYSIKELCDVLYKKGLRSKSGKKVSCSAMRRTLHNPFYAGMMLWKGTKRRGSHEAMISIDELQCIGEIIDAHNSHACRRRKHKFLLRGFVYCNICGQRYTAENKNWNGRLYSYYRCASDGIHSNRFQNASAKSLERQVEETFRDITISPDSTKKILDYLKTTQAEHNAVVESSRQTLLNQKAALQAKRERAEEKLLEGVLSNEDFLRIKEILNNKLAEVDSQLYKLGQTRGLDADVIARVLQLSQSVYSTYKKADYTLKRRYLALFWERIDVQDRLIVEAIPSAIIREIQSIQRFLIRTNSGPSCSLIRNFEDIEYLTEVKEDLNQIEKAA